MEKTMKPKADMVFEISWEVCNKVGGIFTVLSSKASEMQRYYKSDYYLVGPYFPEKSRSDFKEEAAPEKYKTVYNELKNKGIICHFGKWLIDGEPNVILIDFGGFWPQVNNIKREIWDGFKLDSLNSPRDFDEPVLWSWTAGILIEKISKENTGKKIAAHAHEWLSGAAILYLKKNRAAISTVFTTHATSLGRALAGHEIDLYSVLKTINPAEEAYKYCLREKHNMERITAEITDIFTTVSQTTAEEARYILGKEVNLILPNGLDITKFPSFEEATLKHNKYRSKLREFALYYFFPYYNVDLKNTLFFFTASRYEFHNKGLDIFIESLGKLNEKMKKTNSRKTVIVFFWVPAAVVGIKQEIIEARETYRDIKDLLEEEGEDIKENLLYTVSSDEKISERSIFGENSLLEIRKKVIKFRSKEGFAPPLSTHDVANTGSDPVLKAFKDAGLENKKEDKIKVIFYPIYLTGADGLGDLDYYQSIQACHLGVFPSYYEPWGYTPLETAALGVASLTSDLSGFGKYFRDILRNEKTAGVYILNLENKKKEEVIEDFVEILYGYTLFSRKERIDNKIQARKVASMADWKKFARYYLEAHNLAVEKVKSLKLRN